MTKAAERRLVPAGLAFGMLVALAGLAATCAVAQPAPSPRPTPAPEPAIEAARAAFEALPEGERQAIQDALVWTGDHTGVTTGGFGPRTFAAIQSYQRRAGLKPTGVLEAKERAALVTAAKRARDAVAFTVVTDTVAGVRIGIPERLLTKRSASPSGTRWQSAEGKITLDTRAIPAGEISLAALSSARRRCPRRVGR